jgi:O-antigen ligase
VISWGNAISLFLEHPWIGVGFNTYGFVQQRRGIQLLGPAHYSVEGGFLFVAVMTGAVGLFAFLTMLWLVLRRCRGIWRHAGATAEQRGLAIGAAAATAAICVHSVFVNSFMVPFVMEPLWILWGLTFLVAASLRASSAGWSESR